MNQNILKYLKSYSFDTKDVNSLLVTSFLKINKVKNVENTFINQFITYEKKELEQVNDFIKLFDNGTFDIEDLIELFEFVISPQDKEVNGAVFTPEYIRKYIVSNVISKQKSKNILNLKFGDIACGCGGFFKTITEVYKKETRKSYYEIYKDNIFGLDIQEYSIKRTKILLSLFAIINGEDSKEFKFNLYCGNALEFDWSKIESLNKNHGFDIIVGNPPYVGASKIDDLTKDLLKNWSVSKIGKPDLYIPFFEIGITNLNPTGVLGYITVNTFYRSLNGRSVRDYFSNSKFDLSIIDFGGEQLFKKRSTYTCICIIGKTVNSSVKYVKSLSRDIQKIKKSNFIEIPYENLDNFNGWYLIDKVIQKSISKIENCGTPLGVKFEIRNGFATLKNNIYVFKPIKEDLDYYYLLKNNVEFKIEKRICRDAIKPNILKSENEINDKMEKLIFPYTTISSSTNLFGKEGIELKAKNEIELKTNYPHTYKYLKSHKKSLSERDKGKGNYNQWFAFGRNQALTLKGYKLLFPYISSKPCFVLSKDTELLFYNGYALISNSESDLKFVQKILKSDIFWYYIKHTSKPYSGNYFALSKNYIKNFSIPNFTKKERNKFMRLKNKSSINRFLLKKYKITNLG